MCLLVSLLSSSLIRLLNIRTYRAYGPIPISQVSYWPVLVSVLTMYAFERRGRLWLDFSGILACFSDRSCPRLTTFCFLLRLQLTHPILIYVCLTIAFRTGNLVSFFPLALLVLLLRCPSEPWQALGASALCIRLRLRFREAVGAIGRYPDSHTSLSLVLGHVGSISLADSLALRGSLMVIDVFDGQTRRLVDAFS